MMPMCLGSLHTLLFRMIRSALFFGVCPGSGEWYFVLRPCEELGEVVVTNSLTVYLFCKKQLLVKSLPDQL